MKNKKERGKKANGNKPRRECETEISIVRNGILNGSLKKERIGRDPLKLVRANRRFRAWWQCHFGSLSGESTIQFPAISSACAPFHEGWPYQTAAGGSMCRNPSLSLPPLDKSTPLSLCLCNTSVLNTRHIRVPFLSRAVHTDTRFFHSIDNSILISRNLPDCFLTFSLEPCCFRELELNGQFLSEIKLRK